MKCNHGVSVGVLLFGGLLIPSLSFSRADSRVTRHLRWTIRSTITMRLWIPDLANPVMWHDPGQIAKLDLFYGQGGKEGVAGGAFQI